MAERPALSTKEDIPEWSNAARALASGKLHYNKDFNDKKFVDLSEEERTELLRQMAIRMGFIVE
jgi:hypothetical protein